MAESVWVAEMATEHFSFVAVGPTEAAATLAVAKGFSEHLVAYSEGGNATEEEAREYFLAGSLGDDDRYQDYADDDVWALALSEWYGISTVRLAPGECARDWSVIS